MTKDNFSWPKIGDDPFNIDFLDRFAPTSVRPNWFSLFESRDEFLAEGFKELADIAVRAIGLKNDCINNDKYFMPVTYLYRHAFELKLKNIIKQGLVLGDLKPSEKLSDELKRHNLYSLWNFVKKVLIANWPKGPKQDLQAVEGIIQKFHDIDSTGQVLRYTEDNNGQCTAKSLPDFADLKMIEKVSEKLFRFLDSCSMGLSHSIEVKQELESEYFNH